MTDPKFFKVEAVFGPRPSESVFFVVRDELDRSEVDIANIVSQAGFKSPPPGTEMQSSERVEKFWVTEIKESDLRRADLGKEIPIEMTGGIKLWRLNV